MFALEYLTGEASLAGYRRIVKFILLFMSGCMGIFDYISGNMPLLINASILFGLGLVALAGEKIFAVEKAKKIDMLVFWGVCAIVVNMFINSPADSYVFLWLLIIPPGMLVFMDRRTSRIFLIIYCLAVSLACSPLLDHIVFAKYSPHFKIKLPFAVISSSLLCWLLESRRIKAGEQIKALMEGTAKMAMFDPLTNLYNRRSFYDILEKEKARCDRNSTQMAVIMSDLDNFKKVNDTYGHSLGDNVLVKFAELCNSELRAKDYVCRWGGEEFLLLLTDTGIAEGITTAERLRKKLEDTAIILNDAPALFVTASFGVHLYDGKMTVDENIAEADRLMYLAKKSGRNRVCFDKEKYLYKYI